MSQEAEADKSGRKMPKGVEKGMIKVSGKEYLPVPFRLVWLRDEKPLWGISTEIIEAGGYTLVRATVTDETGRTIATAHKAVTGGGKFPPIEKAETGAMGRALGAAGFGTQFGDLDDEEPGVMGGIADSPVQRTRSNATVQTPMGQIDPKTGENLSNPSGAPPTLAEAKVQFHAAVAAIVPMFGAPQTTIFMLAGMVRAICQLEKEPVETVQDDLGSWVYAIHVLRSFKDRYPTASPAYILESMKKAYQTDKVMTQWSDDMWNDLILFGEKATAAP